MLQFWLPFCLYVSSSNVPLDTQADNQCIGSCTQTRRYGCRGFLGRFIVPSHRRRFPASHRLHICLVRSTAASDRFSTVLYRRNYSLLSCFRVYRVTHWKEHPRSWWRRDSHIKHGYLLRHCPAQTASKVLFHGFGFMVNRNYHRPHNRRSPDAKFVVAMVLPHQLPLLRHWLRCCLSGHSIRSC